MKRISILGSTGSIGVQALDVIRANPSRFKVEALACNNNIELLKKQIKEFKPSAVAVFDKDLADKLQKTTKVKVYPGLKGLLEISKIESANQVLNSLVGSIGILPTIEAINAGKQVLLANKETLVAAGDQVMKLANKKKTKIIPVDSEHSAIFQCIQSQNNIKKIILTCSGGAFRDKTLNEMKTLKASDALKHPTWGMGQKITIDSATLMNKGFEVIEAKMLFGIDYDNIEVVIHPQSIVHSLVEFKDTSVLAQMGIPDMKLPIQYALTYPERIKNNLKTLDLAKISKLEFSNPDTNKFPCLKYAYDSGRIGGTMPCVLNASNEVLVDAYLKDKILFQEIQKLIKEAMDSHKIIKNPGIDEILEIDKKIKKETEKKIIW